MASSDKYRMRKFMKLVETITNDFAVNAQIEQILDGLPSEQRTLALDGLELIHNSGEQGMTAQQFMTNLSTMYPDSAKAVEDIWPVVLHSFSQFLQQVGHGHYVFHLPHTQVAEPDTTSMVGQAAQMQIHATGVIMQACKNLGRFTEHDVMQAVAPVLGHIPAAMLRMLIDHVLGANTGVIKTDGAGYYRYDEPQTKTGLSFLKDLEGYQSAPHYDVKLHHDAGSLVGFEPLSEEGRNWIDENVRSESYQWQGNILWIEARYAAEIVRGMDDEGVAVDKLQR